MFADYLHETGYPKHGEVERMMLNPAEHKLMFVVSSEEITDPKTEVIKFTLRRTYLV